MRTTANIKYVKQAMAALKKLGRATACDIADAIGEDRNLVSGAFCGYRRRNMVVVVGWREQSPIFSITEKGCERINAEDGMTNNRIETMQASYTIVLKNKQINVDSVCSVTGNPRKSTSARLLDCKKAGYLVGDNNGRLTTYEITAKGVGFLSKMTGQDVSSDVLKASEARLKAKAAPMHTMLNRIRTPQQLAAMGA